MKRISSLFTPWCKRGIPTILFGILIAIAIEHVMLGRTTSAWHFSVLICAAVFSYYFMKTNVFDLVDEVLDAGDALIERMGRDKQRIPLVDIESVSYSPSWTPPRVVLRLRGANRLGAQVAFSAQESWGPFAKNLVIPELIARIESAQSRSRLHRDSAKSATNSLGSTK